MWYTTHNSPGRHSFGTTVESTLEGKSGKEEPGCLPQVSRRPRDTTLYLSCRSRGGRSYFGGSPPCGAPWPTGEDGTSGRDLEGGRGRAGWPTARLSTRSSGSDGKELRGGSWPSTGYRAPLRPRQRSSPREHLVTPLLNCNIPPKTN